VPGLDGHLYFSRRRVLEAQLQHGGPGGERIAPDPALLEMDVDLIGLGGDLLPAEAVHHAQPFAVGDPGARTLDPVETEAQHTAGRIGVEGEGDGLEARNGDEIGAGRRRGAQGGYVIGGAERRFSQGLDFIGGDIAFALFIEADTPGAADAAAALQNGAGRQLADHRRTEANVPQALVEQSPLAEELEQGETLRVLHHNGHPGIPPQSALFRPFDAVLQTELQGILLVLLQTGEGHLPLVARTVGQVGAAQIEAQLARLEIGPAGVPFGADEADPQPVAALQHPGFGGQDRCRVDPERQGCARAGFAAENRARKTGLFTDDGFHRRLDEIRTGLQGYRPEKDPGTVEVARVAVDRHPGGPGGPGEQVDGGFGRGVAGIVPPLQERGAELGADAGEGPEKEEEEEEEPVADLGVLHRLIFCHFIGDGAAGFSDNIETRPQKPSKKSRFRDG